MMGSMVTASGTREDMLGALADAVQSVSVAHPTRVAIDGAPAAGKTTLADELAVVLRGRGCQVIRATVDDFLFPKVQRYRRGEYSAEGCYFDAHDTRTLRRVLLDPLGPDGDRRFQCGPTSVVETAPTDAVLLFDGVFLMRPELVEHWDLRIFVSVALETTVARAVIRENSAPAEVERRWRERYLPAQRLYFALDRPAEHADIVVHNDDRSAT